MESGASKSVIGKNLADELNIRANYSSPMVTVANGEKVIPIGETDVTFEFKGKMNVTRVVIVDKLPEKFLIGLDFLH